MVRLLHEASRLKTLYVPAATVMFWMLPNVNVRFPVRPKLKLPNSLIGNCQVSPTLASSFWKNVPGEFKPASIELNVAKGPERIVTYPVLLIFSMIVKEIGKAASCMLAVSLMV